MKNKFCFLFFNFAVIVLFTIFGTLLVIDTEKFESFSIGHITNDFCQNAENIHTYIESLVCANPYKKKKFLWLFLDGLAYDQLELLADRKSQKIPNFFKTTSKVYRQSGSLHEIILTGKFSRNYLARQIKSDYLFAQAHQANFELYFRGTRFPLYFLFGEGNSETVKHSLLLYPDMYALLNFCGDGVFYDVSNDTFQQAMSKYFTEDGGLMISRSEFYKEMSEYFSNEISIDAITNCIVRSLEIDPMIPNQKSLIFYMSKIDNMNHSFYKHSAYVIMQVFNTEIGVMSLMKWIDHHPDYALIVSSDHGGQAYDGEDSLCNHGCMREGNEAIFFIYTHDLENEFVETADAEMEEIAPTVAQILERVNIPLESRGFPRFISNNPMMKLVALKSKEIQIQKYIEAEASGGSAQLHNLYFTLKSNKFSAKLAEFTTMADFSLKTLNNSFMLDMTIDLFITSYQDFLRSVQDEVVLEIRNINKSFTVTMFIAVVLIILIGKSCISIKCIIQYLDPTRQQSLIFSPLIVALLMEVILCFVFKNKIPAVIPISRLFIYPVLILVGVLWYCKVEGKEEKDKMRKMILMFLCISIAFPMVDASNIFLGLKYLVISYQFARRLDYFNYLILFIYAGLFTAQFRNVYVNSRLTIKVSYVLCLYIFILLPCMFLFDYFYPKQFVRQEYHMKILIRFTYIALFSLLIFSFKQFYTKKYDPQEKQSIVSNPILSLHLSKLPFVLYLFYISDEGERLFLLTCILPLFHLFSHIYTTTKNNQQILKVYTAVGMIWLPDILLIIMKNTFTLDVSLKVCTKSIGDYPDETPISTGFLMGTHKATLYLLSGVFAVGMIKINKNCINDHSFIFRQALELQISFLLMLYFTILLQEQEEDYLMLFMWAISKCVFACIFDIFTFLCYAKFTCQRKPKIAAVHSNTSDESITIINNEI